MPELLRLYAVILHYFTIIAIIFSIIRLLPQPKVAVGVGIHCRLQTNRIIHIGRTVFVASRSGVDSIRDDQGVVSLIKADTRRTFLSVHTTDVGKPAGTHGRTKRIVQVVKGLGYGLPFVRQHVQVFDEPAIIIWILADLRCRRSDLRHGIYPM